MLIRCGKCNIKNDVIEVCELKDIAQFHDRTLIVGKCKVCGSDIAELIEFRKDDNAPFLQKFVGKDAIKVIKREHGRLKNKISYKKNFKDWVYGINKEIKNKQGNVSQIRQYAADFKGNRSLVKKMITV